MNLHRDKSNELQGRTNSPFMKEATVNKKNLPISPFLGIFFSQHYNKTKNTFHLFPSVTSAEKIAYEKF